ncbi:MAG: RHS repeat protein, partial [Chlamydiia bacterium]|nr:RHS repeat protein [Chlamydiia bacterium]
MRRLFLLSLLLSFLFAGKVSCDSIHILDTPENHFQTSTPYKIAPHVNPITGDLLEEEIDLVVAGCEPLSLRRFYNHNAPFEPRTGGWSYNPEHLLAANFELLTQGRFAAVGDFDGSVIPFKSSSAPYTYVFDMKEGYIHTGRSPHPLNTKLTYCKMGDPKDKTRWAWIAHLTNGNGRQCRFESPRHAWMTFKDVKMSHPTRDHITISMITPNVWTPYEVSLREERLPNGNILCYSYERWHKHLDDVYPSPPLLTKITAYNSTQTKELGHLTLSYTKDHKDRVKAIQVIGSDERGVSFAHTGDEPKLLHHVNGPDQSISYGHQKMWINRVERPEGRVITTEYKEGKVAAQYAPIGPKGEMCPIGRYVYQKDHTIVYDAEGNKTIIRFDANKRPLCTETYQGEALYKVERPTWNREGDLLRTTIEDASGHLVQIKEYEYDSRHNPITESVGEGNIWQRIHRTYSEDGFNLKLSESDREGRKKCYAYVPNTNLLSSELFYENDQIKRRSFHTYDDCAVCIRTVIDDGTSQNPKDLTGVTFCKITEVKPRQSKPCFGLPEVVLEKTINDSEQEILLHKTVFTYAPCGKVLQEDHYDAEGVFRYSIHNTYDNHERLASTTDALGNTTRFIYDSNNNLTSIEGPQHKEITYDLANRPIRIADWQSDGTILTLETRYDKLGQVIAEVDACGNVTRFEYDALGRKTAVYHPDEAIERQEYDLLGNMIKKNDAQGYETRTSCDFRGKPLSIFYPDGKEEHFTYTPEGLVATHTDKNGAKSFFTHDVFDHPIRVEVYSASGELLKVKTATYTAFYKLSETDEANVTTTYSYDYAWRKMGEETADKRISYT